MEEVASVGLNPSKLSSRFTINDILERDTKQLKDIKDTQQIKETKNNEKMPTIRVSSKILS